MSRRSVGPTDDEEMRMAKRTPGKPLAMAPLDRAGADPLHRQVYERLLATSDTDHFRTGAAGYSKEGGGYHHPTPIPVPGDQAPGQREE
jgi:hypothetical protein